jgi:hypothetical protein
MGSGFNFFTNAYDVTPTTKGAWVDVDVSSYIPSGSTGVILEVQNTDTTYAREANVRKNGSTDDRRYYITLSNAIGMFAGVDGNRIFEAFVAAYIKMWLIGYTDENVYFFDNAILKTPGTTGSWVDVDVSGDVPIGTTGVIVQLIVPGYYNPSAGVRKNGSTDTFSYSSLYYNLHIFQLCGVDANRVFECQVSSTTQVQVWLAGYTKSPVTFFTNAVDVSLTTTGAWTDVDVTAYTGSAADGAIIYFINTSGSKYQANVRKNGSSDNRITSEGVMTPYGSGHVRAIGMDSGQIFEGYIENVAVDFFLIGYCQPAPLLKTCTQFVTVSQVSFRKSMKPLTQPIKTTVIVTKVAQRVQAQSVSVLAKPFLQTAKYLPQPATVDVSLIKTVNKFGLESVLVATTPIEVSQFLRLYTQLTIVSTTPFKKSEILKTQSLSVLDTKVTLFGMQRFFTQPIAVLTTPTTILELIRVLTQPITVVTTPSWVKEILRSLTQSVSVDTVLAKAIQKYAAEIVKPCVVIEMVYVPELGRYILIIDNEIGIIT